MRDLRWTWLLIGVVACDDGVAGLEETRQILATVRGRLTRPLAEISATIAHPRAGILWAGVPQFVPFCHEHGPNPRDPSRIVSSSVARYGCRDPFEVVPGAMGPSVVIDPRSASFEIPIADLPRAQVMVGSVEARVAYGSLIVFDDLDGDGELDLERGCNSRGDSSGPSPRLEPIHAASFFSQNETQVRVTYVEGRFDAASLFYPHPDCSELPPPGFSIWTVGALLDPDASCSTQRIDAEIRLDPRAPLALADLTCLQSSRDVFPRPPPVRPPGSALIFECNADGALVAADPTCSCPWIRTYRLSGCYDSLDCPNPDWDLRASVPPEWPCPVDGDPGP
ncbi:MAG: hypothetical protein IT384_14475 [Deltaproteobacteria bacterium]|nr:hypothetical protein [Deltaproteobacteria bacterium]